jgi:hypothetical protein
MRDATKAVEAMVAREAAIRTATAQELQIIGGPEMRFPHRSVFRTIGTGWRTFHVETSAIHFSGLRDIGRYREEKLADGHKSYLYVGCGNPNHFLG